MASNRREINEVEGVNGALNNRQIYARVNPRIFKEEVGLTKIIYFNKHYASMRSFENFKKN